MNTTKPKLTNPTDDELGAAVAGHVAGLTDVREEEGEDVDIECRTIYPWRGLRGTLGGKRIHVPPYATSADAVLPLLEKHDAIITHSVKERDWRVVIEGGRCNSAPTLPRAACIALLRANGIEVEQTATR